MARTANIDDDKYSFEIRIKPSTSRDLDHATHANFLGGCTRNLQDRLGNRARSMVWKNVLDSQNDVSGKNGIAGIIIIIIIIYLFTPAVWATHVVDTVIFLYVSIRARSGAAVVGVALPSADRISRERGNAAGPTGNPIRRRRRRRRPDEFFWYARPSSLRPEPVAVPSRYRRNIRGLQWFLHEKSLRIRDIHNSDAHGSHRPTSSVRKRSRLAGIIANTEGVAVFLFENFDSSVWVGGCS